MEEICTANTDERLNWSKSSKTNQLNNIPSQTILTQNLCKLDQEQQYFKISIKGKHFIIQPPKTPLFLGDRNQQDINTTQKSMASIGNEVTSSSQFVQQRQFLANSEVQRLKSTADYVDNCKPITSAVIKTQATTDNQSGFLPGTQSQQFHLTSITNYEQSRLTPGEVFKQPTLTPVSNYPPSSIASSSSCLQSRLTAVSNSKQTSIKQVNNNQQSKFISDGISQNSSLTLCVSSQPSGLISRPISRDHSKLTIVSRSNSNSSRRFSSSIHKADITLEPLKSSTCKSLNVNKEKVFNTHSQDSYLKSHDHRTSADSKSRNLDQQRKQVSPQLSRNSESILSPRKQYHGLKGNQILQQSKGQMQKQVKLKSYSKVGLSSEDCQLDASKKNNPNDFDNQKITDVKPCKIDNQNALPAKKISLQQYRARKSNEAKKPNELHGKEVIERNNEQKGLSGHNSSIHENSGHVVDKSTNYQHEVLDPSDSNKIVVTIPITSPKEQNGSEDKELVSEPTTILPEKENVEQSTDKSIVEPGGGGSQNLNGDFVSLRCRYMHVGSYHTVPKQRVIFAETFIYFIIPSIVKDDSPVALKLRCDGIITILYYFGPDLSIMCLHVRPSMAAYIRTSLKMSNKNSVYFDPKSDEESQRRIIFVFENVDETDKNAIIDYYDVKKTLKNGQKWDFLNELDQDVAFEIFLNSSPVDVTPVPSVPTSYTRPNTERLLIYPPPPNTGGITITTDDYCCLEEEQFLNDVIIDFYLRWLLLNKLSEKDRDRTHIFSTFFYQRLTSKHKKEKSAENDPTLTPAQKRHARVKSWTKDVDIFEKDFIIVPINEHSHWFLAVICFPGLDGPVTIADEKPDSKCSKIEKLNLPNPDSVHRTEIPVVGDVDCSDRDEAEGDEDELQEDSERDEVKCKNVEKMKTMKNYIKKNYIENQIGEQSAEPQLNPCILIFDSLQGASRARIVATLRDYLSVEYEFKKGKKKEFSKENMKGACPKVPQQKNFFDCGLFTLQFAESFFNHPLKDFKFPIRTLIEWFQQDVVSSKREIIAQLIRTLMDQIRPNHGIILPLIHFNSSQQNNLPSKQKSTSTKERSERKCNSNKVTNGCQDNEESSLKLNINDKNNSNHSTFKRKKKESKNELQANCFDPCGSDVASLPAQKKIKITLLDNSSSVRRPSTPTPFEENKFKFPYTSFPLYQTHEYNDSNEDISDQCDVESFDTSLEQDSAEDKNDLCQIEDVSSESTLDTNTDSGIICSPYFDKHFDKNENNDLNTVKKNRVSIYITNNSKDRKNASNNVVNTSTPNYCQYIKHPNHSAEVNMPNMPNLVTKKVISETLSNDQNKSNFSLPSCSDSFSDCSPQKMDRDCAPKKMDKRVCNGDNVSLRSNINLSKLGNNKTCNSVDILSNCSGNSSLSFSQSDISRYLAADTSINISNTSKMEGSSFKLFSSEKIESSEIISSGKSKSGQINYCS